MKIFHCFPLTLLLIFSKGFYFPACAEIAKSDSCSKDEVRKYSNTVDEFYGAIQALYSDSSLKSYPAFYNALGAGNTMSKNTKVELYPIQLRRYMGLLRGPIMSTQIKVVLPIS